MVPRGASVSCKPVRKTGSGSEVMLRCNRSVWQQRKASMEICHLQWNKESRRCFHTLTCCCLPAAPVTQLKSMKTFHAYDWKLLLRVVIDYGEAAADGHNRSEERWTTVLNSQTNTLLLLLPNIPEQVWPSQKISRWLSSSVLNSTKP